MLGLTDEELAIYRAVLRNPKAEVVDLCRAAGMASTSEVRDTLAVLRTRGLVLPDVDRPAGVRPVHPSVVLAGSVAAAELDLERRSSAIATDRRELALAVDDYLYGRELATASMDIERLDGVAAVRRRIDELAETTLHEMLAVVTGFGTDDSEAIAAARDEDFELLGRGVRIRTIYPTTIRNLPVSWAYAMETALAGEEVRLSDEVPMRMIVLDRQLALIPADTNDLEAGALVVRCSPVVSAFVALFELCWQRASPVLQCTDSRELDGDDTALLHLLAAGAKDETVARHRGCHVRTVRRDIAAIMSRMEASTRFQAGVEASRRGWV